MSEQSLKNKTVKGVGWTVAETLSRNLVTFLVGIVLARLLSPDDYGLIGILLVYVSVFEIIIDGGLSNALIRKQDAKDIDYSTMFYANLFVSILMAAIVFFSAKPIASFFERQELVSLTQAMSCIVVIYALSLVPKVRLTKAINFKSQTKASFISAIISGAIGIYMAYRGYGVWSLVGQQLCNATINVILLWIANCWIPQLIFSTNSFISMWSFGWKLLLSGILNTISNQMFQAIIGKCYTPALLGQYTRAEQFGSLVSGNVTRVVQRVSYPVLSTIQNDPNRLKEAYKQIIKVTLLPTFVCMLCLASCAKPLIMLLLGKPWLESAFFLQILCLSLMLYPLHALNLNAIQVMGRSDLTLRINVVKNLLILFPITVGIMYGIYWMLAAEVIRGGFCYFLNAYYSKPLLNYSIKEQLLDIYPSFKIAFFTASPLYLISFIPIQYYFLVPIQFAIGITLCLILCEKSHLQEYIELKHIFLRWFVVN